jgi:hypothetical protein
LGSPTSRSAISWLKPRLTTTQRGQVGAVVGEGVGRDEPAALAERVGDVEDREVVDVVGDRKGKDGKLVTACEQLKWAKLLDLPRNARGDVPRVGLDTAEAVEAEPEEVVVLSDHLGARSREIEREGRHVVAEIVDPEDQLFG